jgi:hypothetical protein
MSENDNSRREGLQPNGDTLLAGNTQRGAQPVTSLREPRLDIGFDRNPDGTWSAKINLPSDRSPGVMPLLTVTDNYRNQLRDVIQNRLNEMGTSPKIEVNGKARGETGNTTGGKIEGSVPVPPGTVGGNLESKLENRSSIELGITFSPGRAGLDRLKQQELQELFDSTRREIYRDWAKEHRNGTTVNYSDGTSLNVRPQATQGYLNNPEYVPFQGRTSDEIWWHQNSRGLLGKPDANPVTNPDLLRPNGPRSEGPSPDTQVANNTPTNPNGVLNPATTMPSLGPAALNPNATTPGETPAPGTVAANTTPTNPNGTFVASATMPPLGAAVANPPSADLSNGAYGQLYGKIQEGVNNLPRPMNPDLLRVDNSALTNALTFDAAQRAFDPSKEVNVARGKGDNENMVFAGNGPLNNPATPIARVDSNNLPQPTVQQIAALPPPPAAVTEDIALRETRTMPGRSVG